MPLIPDSIITFDRAYVDFKLFQAYEDANVFFVTRSKENLRFELLGQQDITKKKGLQFDQIVQIKDLSAILCQYKILLSHHTTPLYDARRPRIPVLSQGVPRSTSSVELDTKELSSWKVCRQDDIHGGGTNVGRTGTSAHTDNFTHGEKIDGGGCGARSR